MFQLKVYGFQQNSRSKVVLKFCVPVQFTKVCSVKNKRQKLYQKWIDFKNPMPKDSNGIENGEFKENIHVIPAGLRAAQEKKQASKVDQKISFS